MGELGIRSLLHDGHGDWERALQAAEGWGGDRFAVYEKRDGERKGSRLLVWISEWDTELDEQEFQVAAAGLGNGWKVVGTAPRRVVTLRGEFTDSQREAILARLAAAPAERPVNREIDLAAIGAKAPAL